MYGTCLGSGAPAPRANFSALQPHVSRLPVYGTDIYTDDSPPAAAAVHAGLVGLQPPPFSPQLSLSRITRLSRAVQVAPGATRDLLLTIHGPRAGFIGSVRNGVASKSVSKV